ncbi:hypothetical protein TRVL_05526 [Trypanosoma vivax]|nr:hypothetical protein TRVL_05526 [Trypanosoma vivax]
MRWYLASFFSTTNATSQENKNLHTRTAASNARSKTKTGAVEREGQTGITALNTMVHVREKRESKGRPAQSSDGRAEQHLELVRRHGRRRGTDQGSGNRQFRPVDLGCVRVPHTGMNEPVDGGGCRDTDRLRRGCSQHLEDLAQQRAYDPETERIFGASRLDSARSLGEEDGVGCPCRR